MNTLIFDTYMQARISGFGEYEIQCQLLNDPTIDIWNRTDPWSIKRIELQTSGHAIDAGLGFLPYPYYATPYPLYYRLGVQLNRSHFGVADSDVINPYRTTIQTANDFLFVDQGMFHDSEISKKNSFFNPVNELAQTRSQDQLWLVGKLQNAYRGMNPDDTIPALDLTLEVSLTIRYEVIK